MKKYLSLLGVMSATVFLAACVTVPVALAPSNTYIGPNDVVTEIGPASGSAWGGTILGLPTGEIHQMEGAIKRALSSSGGDALIGVTVDFKTYNFFVATLMQTNVRGTAVKIKKGAR